MKPFVFRFKEVPTAEDIDYSLIEYDHHLNLSIDKKTGRPAIEFAQMDTETFTRTHGESSDSDNEGLSLLMDTNTFTKTYGEEADPENDLRMLMETETHTFTDIEDSDSDRDRKSIESLIDTSMLTERIEATDQDK